MVTGVHSYDVLWKGGSWTSKNTKSIDGRKRGNQSRMEQSPIFKEIKRLKKNWVLNWVKGVVTAEKNPTQLSIHSVKGIKEKLRARCCGAHFQPQHSEGRSWWISKFKVSLIYRVSSVTAKFIKWNKPSKTKFVKVYLNKGAMFQPHEAAELGSFGYMVLDNGWMTKMPLKMARSKGKCLK